MGRGNRLSALENLREEDTWPRALKDATSFKQAGLFGEIDADAQGILREKGVLLKDLLKPLGECAGEVKVFAINNCSVQFVARLNNQAGEAEVRMRRTIDFKEGVAYHNSFEIVNPESQKKGLGLNLFLASLQFYKKHQINKVELYANSSVGGYFWARVGFFIPSNKEAVLVRAVTNQAINELSELLWKIESLKDPGLKETVSDLKTNLNFLESLLDKDPFPVGDLAAFRPKVREGSAKEELLEELSLLDGQASSPYSGKSLLLGTGWAGTFELNNPECQAALKRYIS